MGNRLETSSENIGGDVFVWTLCKNIAMFNISSLRKLSVFFDLNNSFVSLNFTY